MAGLKEIAGPIWLENWLPMAKVTTGLISALELPGVPAADLCVKQ